MALVKWGVAAASGLVIAVVGAFASTGVFSDSYELELVMNNAATIHQGTPVEVGGDPAGEVRSVKAEGGHARVTVDLTDKYSPLPSGTKGQVEWLAALGERIVSLQPGASTNEKLPSGAMIRVAKEQVDVDELLSTLDPGTRKHLSSTIEGLHETTDGHTRDANALLKESGPAVAAAGEVLRAVGEDGHAIRGLVTNLRDVVGPLAARNDELSGTANSLAGLTDQLSQHEEQLGQGINQLPGTLAQSKRTLDAVPGTVDKTVPLLDDLKPATDKLPAAAKNLAPLLRDVRPAVGELRPTLNSTSELFQDTPALLGSAHDVVPGLHDAVDRLNPAVEFLRPYAPDLVGWLSNWGGGFSGYDSKGNFGAALARAGVNSVDNNPGLSTFKSEDRPSPGMASGRPWKDAYGSGMR